MLHGNRTPGEWWTFFEESGALAHRTAPGRTPPPDRVTWMADVIPGSDACRFQFMRMEKEPGSTEYRGVGGDPYWYPAASAADAARLDRALQDTLAAQAR